MRTALALVVVACGSPRPQVPRDVLPYDEGFVMSSQRLRATLARDNILLDTQPVLRTCEEPTPDRECARCDVATVLDEIDPDLVDRMAIAFARYPSSMRKAARLEHVAFCNAITYIGKHDHGPAGLASPSDHRVFISVEYFRNGNSGSSIEATVHHEVFHLLDYEVFNAPVADSEWNALNPAGYLGPNERLYAPRGFVTAYASTNEREDRASTFAQLMDRPDELCALAAKDPIVARKVRLLWQRVSRVEGAHLLGVKAPCATKAPKKPKPKRGKRADLKLRLDDSR